MARIRPFRAYTYARDSHDITPLVAPPYDVIHEDERASLLSRSEHNVVALELAEGPTDPSSTGNRYETAAHRWREWREDDVVVRDDQSAFYLLEQRFELAGARVKRRALIAEVALHAFEERIVLPHERTLPKALGDRHNLITSTHANFSQIFGLLDDPERVLARTFDQLADSPPSLAATDDAGVESVVWTVTDPARIALIAEGLAAQRIFIADGHHRYTVALAYRDERRAADATAGRAPDDPDYDYVMMALVDMDDPELVVLPTHRVADSAEPFDSATFYADMSRLFEVTEVGPGHPSDALDAIERPAFLVRTRTDERPRVAVVRPEVDLDVAIPLQRSHAWKELDVAVLQELVLQPFLGIHPDRPETLDRLRFVKDAHDALKMTESHDVAFVLRHTRMDQMRAVALAGDVMPQKSTYFYPKLLSGLVFRSMDTPLDEQP